MHLDVGAFVTTTFVGVMRFDGCAAARRACLVSTVVTFSLYSFAIRPGDAMLDAQANIQSCEKAMSDTIQRDYGKEWDDLLLFASAQIPRDVAQAIETSRERLAAAAAATAAAALIRPPEIVVSHEGTHANA